MQRIIEAGSFKRAPEGETLDLAYQYRRGLVLRYQATIAMRQRIDAGNTSTGTRHEEGDIRVTIKVLDRDETDGGFYVVIYHEPLGYRIDGVAQKAGPRRLIYVKHDATGHIIESTDASGANVLLLPGQPLNVGAQWRETQTFVPPQRMRPLDVAGSLTVSALNGPVARIDYEAAPVEYKGELPGTQATSFRSQGKGWFDFDAKAGLLSGLRIETLAHSEDTQATYDMDSVFEMKLQSIG